MKNVEEKDIKNPPDVVHQEIVVITVDNKRYKIQEGHRSVSEIKTVGQVPQAYTLVQVEGHKLTPLPDDGFVNIKGGEEFKSHPKDGGNS